MFIETAFADPHLFTYRLITVVVSIVLHELAHGWVAIWQGDDTPRCAPPNGVNHMTANPIVHMSVFSIILFICTGMAFGLMPVNPRNFRSKYGDAMVSVAGPLMNILLAVIALIGMGIWIKTAGHFSDLPTFQANTQEFLWYFATTNIALAMLNLLPIPPLDGSTILANFHPPFRRFIDSVSDPAFFYVALIGLMILFSNVDLGFFDLAADWSLEIIKFVSGDSSLILERRN